MQALELTPSPNPDSAPWAQEAVCEATSAACHCTQLGCPQGHQSIRGCHLLLGRARILSSDSLKENDYTEESADSGVPFVLRHVLAMRL